MSLALLLGKRFPGCCLYTTAQQCLPPLPGGKWHEGRHPAPVVTLRAQCRSQGPAHDRCSVHASNDKRSTSSLSLMLLWSRGGAWTGVQKWMSGLPPFFHCQELKFPGFRLPLCVCVRVCALLCECVSVGMCLHVNCESEHL